MDADGVVGSALVILLIAEATRESDARPAVFTEGERAYARSKTDPERRLAARLAAKQAAVRLLGDDIDLSEVEVVRGRGGPPRLRLSARAQERLATLGAERVLVSLTHEREHAAASVLFLRDAG